MYAIRSYYDLRAVNGVNRVGAGKHAGFVFRQVGTLKVAFLGGRLDSYNFV